MIEKILNNKWAKLIIGILVYLLIVYETGAKVYDTYTWLLLLFILLAFNKIKLYNKEYFKTSFFLSLIYSFLEVFGKTTYSNMFNSSACIDTIFFTANKFLLLVLTWIFIYVLLINLFEVFDKYKLFEKEKRDKSKQVFILTALVVLLARIPYFLALYPGVLSADSIREFNMIALPNTPLSNHHPLIHVLFMYIPYSIGMVFFHNANAAVATVTVIQMIITSLITGYIITFLYKRNVKTSYLVMALLFYALLPVNSYYSVTMWKDVIFSYLLVLLIIKIYYLYKEYFDMGKISTKTLISFGIISFLCVMFRNNAIYAYVFLIVVMSLCFSKELKKVLITTISVVLVYCIITIPIYNAIGVIQSESSEYIAMPLQQIGRMAYKDVQFTNKETKTINKLIKVEKLKEAYYPANVDTIKLSEYYHREVFDNNKSEYFKTWLSLVVKHPRTAIEAYCMATLGYWYPGTRWWVTRRYVHENDLGMYQDPKGIKAIDKLILREDELSQDVPLLNLFLSIGFGFWIMLFLLVLSMKKKKETIVFFAPLIGIWITMMIASPVYGEYRYVYSVFLSLPVLGMVPYIETKQKKKSKLQMSKLMQQILRFGVVGGLAFIVDYTILIICKEVFDLNVLLSAAIAFSVSVIFNYILSITWVFDVNQEKSKRRNFILFIVLSIVGLILTEIIMWFGTDIVKIHYLIVKIIATAIVMVFNFVTRKKFLE